MGRVDEDSCTVPRRARFDSLETVLIGELRETQRTAGGKPVCWAGIGLNCLQVPPASALGEVGHRRIACKQVVDDARRLDGAGLKDQAHSFAYEPNLGDILPSNR